MTEGYISRLSEVSWGGLSYPSYEGLAFGPTSGPAPHATPIAPPASLFPAITGAIQAQGPAAIGTATKTYSDAASGVDVDKIYKSIVEASKRGTSEGQSNIMSAMGASGMAGSSDAMRGVADFNLQSQANLLAQLQQMQFQNEAVKMAGAQGLMDTYGNAGMAFAPTQEIVSGSAGPSAFSQVAPAASGIAMSIAMLMMMCWIAAELYGGWNTPEVFHLRNFLATRRSRAGKSFRWLYIKFGRQIAFHIHEHKFSRAITKLLFDWLFKLAFNWRIS